MSIRRYIITPLVGLLLAACGGGGGSSPNLDLADLSISTGPLAPAFDASISLYSVGPLLLDSSVQLTATTVDPTTVVTINAVPTPSGTPSAAIALPVGVTPVTITVTAPGGALRTTTVVFNRAGPTAQRAYVKASNSGVSDTFGSAIAISADTLVVGAQGEDSAATGVNGAESDNTSAQAGAAYVFVRNGGVWAQQAYLKASNTGTLDGFGVSVDISGDTIVVGASGEDSNALGVNAGATGEADNSASGAGAAYVFVRGGPNWTQQAYLKASNTQSGDSFGAAVAISGDTIVVGAQNEASNAVGVNAGAAAEANNAAAGAGAAYVFVRSAGSWSQQAYAKASNTGGGDGFGFRVAASGDTFAVGTPSENGNGIGVNPGAAAEANNSFSTAGAVYVFSRNGTTWAQQAYVKASNTGALDRFGWSVRLDGDTLVVGAPGEQSNATGVNPGAAAEANNSSLDSGAVYVYLRVGTTWTQQAYVKASTSEFNDHFGSAVALSGDLLVVGVPDEDGNAVGIEPGAAAEADNGLTGAGAVYAYLRTGSTWMRQAFIKASNSDASDNFGVSVGCSGAIIVSGAQLEDGNGVGVNPGAAAENDDSLGGSGAVYIFR